MGLKSLQSKLLIAVSCFVIGSGALISLLVTHRFSASLLEAITAQADSLAHAVALEATDKILINDLVALQRMLEHQMRSNASLAYLFIVRDGRILAHTFPRGMPSELIGANLPADEDRGHLQRIASTDNEHYLDIAWPIFSGRAGVLRLGYSEKPLRNQVKKLWLQMSALTFGVLVIAVGGGLVFVRRITLPLSTLSAATKRIDEGDLDAEVQVHGRDEVADLAASFNHMVSRVRDYTSQLETKAKELERSHNQTRTFCEVVREIGALPTLHEIGPALIKRFQKILVCHDMALLVLNDERTTLYVLSLNGARTTKDAERIRVAVSVLNNIPGLTFVDKSDIEPALMGARIASAVQYAAVSLSEDGQDLGALLIGCPGDCSCELKEIQVVGLILQQAVGVIRRALTQEEAANELRVRIEASAEFFGIVGKDPKMQTVYRLIEDTAVTDATVLIQGESGTGKELVARAIHVQSARRDKPFVVINCSAYPDTLLESELFGHEKGAFTGAIRRKSGRFEQADGGTVFLDEIGEIPPPAQIKLLRVLQTQRFERLGGEQTLNVDVRILAATNKSLLDEVRKGAFREDLYYRLNVIPIVLPPLRERRNDIPSLARYFLAMFAAEQGKEIAEFGPDAMRKILDHSWPGNVRELENTIEHAVVLAKGSRIESGDLPSAVRNAFASAPAEHEESLMGESERALLEKVLAECAWNKKKAARRLGIGRTTLYAKLKKYRIVDPTLQ
jgi:two-component system response regulator HydG